MIAFGSSIPHADAYRQYAEPGIRRAAEPDSTVLAFAGFGSVGRGYNLVLDTAAAHADLEALVIVHPYLEIVDVDLCQKVRRALADEQVGVVGCVGATGVRSMAWWEGSVTSAPAVHRYSDLGGGELQAFSWTRPEPPPDEVEMVDGYLLVLSPWAVRDVRFDESLNTGYGWDLDFCLQVRAAGRKVVVADLHTIQHRSLDIVEDQNLWVQGHLQLADKWDTRLAGLDDNAPEWKQIARQAEAEAEAQRTMTYFNKLASDARVLELERRLTAITHTRSWRMTESLRRANTLRRTFTGTRG